MNTPNFGQHNNNFNKPVMPVLKTQPVVPVVAAPKNRSAAKIAGWLAVGVVVGVVLAWAGTALIKSGSATPVAGASQNATSSTAAATTTEADTSLVVATPQKAGLSVAIDKVAVSQPTWVVVYESLDGKPGNVLGAQIFTAADQSGTVELLRGTRAGQTYFVTEQTDNGDRRFSLKDDALLVVGGQPLWVTFTVN